MAFFLRTLGQSASDSVELAGRVDIPAGADFEIEFKVKANESDFLRTIGDTSSLANRTLIFTGSNPTVRLQLSNATVDFTTVGGVNAQNLNVYRFVRVSNSITLYINDVIQSTRTASGSF